MAIEMELSVPRTPKLASVCGAMSLAARLECKDYSSGVILIIYFVSVECLQHAYAT